MTIKTVIKCGSISVLALVLVAMYPASVAIAQETTDPPPATEPASEPTPDPAVESNSSSTPPTDTTAQNQPAEATRGPAEPNGAGSDTYSYNEETGMWENDYYIWDPVTKQTKPKEQQTYSYNPDTGRWDTTEWLYNPTSGKYEPNVLSISTAELPEGNHGSNGIFDLFYDASISNNILMDATTGNASVAGNTLAGSALSGNVTLVNRHQIAP